MLLHWNGKGPLSLPKCNIAGDVVVLIPGSLNEVNKGIWEKVQTSPRIKDFLEKGILKIVKGGGESGSDVTSLKPAQAKELVAQTFDKKLLTKWQETESRKTVLSAIEKQLDEITIKKEDEDE